MTQSKSGSTSGRKAGGNWKSLSDLTEADLNWIKQERILEEDLANTRDEALDKGSLLYVGRRACSNHGMLLRLASQRFCPACFRETTLAHRGTWAAFFEENKEMFQLTNLFLRQRLKP